MNFWMIEGKSGYGIVDLIVSNKMNILVRMEHGEVEKLFGKGWSEKQKEFCGKCVLMNLTFEEATE